MRELKSGEYYFSFRKGRLNLCSLKVRAEFVQLAENELEEKRKHCKLSHAWSYILALTFLDKSVVDAFRNALTLLQAPTLKR